MEKTAQLIYNKLATQQPKALDLVLLSLSGYYSDDPVMLLDDWVKSFTTDDLYELMQTAQDSKELHLDDKYVRAGLYYYSVKTSDRVSDLVDKEEAIQWITQSLEDDYTYVAELVASCTVD